MNIQSNGCYGSLYPFTYVFIYLFISLFIYLFIHLFIHSLILHELVHKCCQIKVTQHFHTKSVIISTTLKPAQKTCISFVELFLKKQKLNNCLYFQNMGIKSFFN